MPKQARVKIGASTACASYWLAPRIANFADAFPQVELHLFATDHEKQLAQDDLDLAIRYGKPDWPNVTSLFLFGEEIFPVCSPAYLEEHPGLRTIEDLMSATLLHWEGAPSHWIHWPQWFGAKGMTFPGPVRGSIFNNYSLLMQAAVNGQGLSLAWRYIVDDLLEKGQLVRPIDTSLQSDAGYYLITPVQPELPAEVSSCASWIVKEALCSSRKALPSAAAAVCTTTISAVPN